MGDQDTERFIDVVQDWVQVLQHALVQNEVLKEIPGLKTALTAANAIGSVRDQILIQKLQAFLTSFSEVSAEQRKEMVGRLEGDAAYGRRARDQRH